MAGVSYYKAFIPKTLLCEAFPVDRPTAEFLQNFYEKGLAEFALRKYSTAAAGLESDMAR